MKAKKKVKSKRSPIRFTYNTEQQAEGAELVSSRQQDGGYYAIILSDFGKTAVLHYVRLEKLPKKAIEKVMDDTFGGWMEAPRDNPQFQAACVAVQRGMRGAIWNSKGKGRDVKGRPTVSSTAVLSSARQAANLHARR